MTIRNLSNKMDRLEDGRNNPPRHFQEGGVRNEDKYRRPFNPQLFKEKG